MTRVRRPPLRPARPGPVAPSPSTSTAGAATRTAPPAPLAPPPLAPPPPAALAVDLRPSTPARWPSSAALRAGLGAVWAGTLRPAVAGALLGAALLLGPSPEGVLPSAGAAEQAVATQPARATPHAEPARLGAIADAVAGAVRALPPDTLATRFELLDLLARVEDGDLTLAVPLRPGAHEIGGQRLEIAPGTVARLHVAVHEGRLTPGRDRRGARVEGGTRVEIHPAPRVFGWITADGVDLREGERGAELTADLRGWFDRGIARAPSLGVADVLAALRGGPSDGASALSELLDASALTIEHGDLTLSASTLDFGAVRLGLAEGSRLSVGGAAGELHAAGHVAVRELALGEGGLAIHTAGGSAALQVDVHLDPSGAVRTTTRFTDLQLADARLDLGRPPAAAHAPAALRIDAATVHHGTLTLETASAPPGSSAPDTSSFRAELGVRGAFGGASVSVPDARGSVSVELGPGQLDGTVEVGTGGLHIDAALADTSLQVGGLQARVEGGTLDLPSAVARGDARVRFDSVTDAFEVDLAVKSLAARAERSAQHLSGADVQVRRVDLTGHGHIHASTRGGLRASGTVDVSARLGVRTASGPKDSASVSGDALFAVLEQIESGRLEVNLPIRGRVGEGLSSATFAPGTTMKVTAAVAHGRIVPSATRLELDQPGDAPLWVEVRGAYLDREGSVRLDLSGAPDLVYGDLERLPLSLPAFARRLLASAGGGAADVALGPATYHLRDARPRGGRLALPGGQLALSPESRVSIDGTGEAATVSARVVLSDLLVPASAR